MTVVQKTPEMDFERELVKRFFNPRSYFFLCVSEHLRARRPLDEPGAEEEYTLVAALMDRLVNADDPRDELKKLSNSEPFAEYVRILEESIERFRKEALPPDKLKAAIENVAVLFLDATLACLEDASCRLNLFEYLGLEAEAFARGPASPDVAFVGEKALEPEPVEARFEEEAFLAAYFRGNVSDEFRKVDEAGGEAPQRAKAYLAAFYNVRDLAMIHGEEDVETLSAKMAELLRRELTRGDVRPEVLSLAERVRLFIQDYLSQSEETDPEQIRVLVGILQDALLGHMPEIVMAVDLEESPNPETELQPASVEPESSFRSALEEPLDHQVGGDKELEFAETGFEQTVSPSDSDLPEEHGTDRELGETEETPQPEWLAPSETPVATAESGQEPEEEESAAKDDSPEAGENAPEWGFAEMIGIEEFLDLDEEPETAPEAGSESPTPEEEHEAAVQAEIFAESFSPGNQQGTLGPSDFDAESEDFRLPGEDDEELLALIREVRSHSERLSREGNAPETSESRGEEQVESETAAEPAEVSPTTRLGYGPHAQEAALYLRVMRGALTALRTNPTKRSALEDLDLAASSLKNILKKLGDTKLWAVPSALSATATVLMEKGTAVRTDFLEAAEEALALLESGPAPAINGKVGEIVEKLSQAHTESVAESGAASAAAADDNDLNADLARPPFRLRGRRSVKEHRHATGL